MPIDVIANHAQIVAAINGFSSAYHADYLGVRHLVTPYVAEPAYANVAPLAFELSAVLCRWGAGRRKAPTVLPLSAVEETLMDPAVHAFLSRFASMPLTVLALASGTHRTIGGVATTNALAAFDTDLHRVLLFMSNGILTNNTNVTYPMKALLLLTGFMPALDSQVRKGLGAAGITGMNLTQFTMPANVHTTEGMKLTRLPFLLADCLYHNSQLLTAAASSSNYPWLAAETGRLFDVLLFMQGSENHKIFSLVPSGHPWYHLP
jgi:hypothetical protein